jgi:hypothetical protein
VRLLAATHALFWDEALARAALERLSAMQPGIADFEAKTTLREYNAGWLDTTWKPS